MTLILFSVKPGPTVVVPVLSSPNAGTPTSSGTSNATVSTDTGNGTLYWAVVTNGGSATNAQIKAGTGGNIVAGVAGNQAVSASGTQTVTSITGLSAGTTYQIIFLQTSGASVDSAQSSVSLTTSSVTYATWDPANKSASITLSNGNLTMVTSSGAGGMGAHATISKSAGKWYWEVTDVSSSNLPSIGVGTSAASNGLLLGNDAFGWGYAADGNKYHSGSATAYGATYTNGDVIGVALDADAGSITFYKNGVSQGVAYTGLPAALFAMATCYSTNNTLTANFGASAFSYSVPSGYNSGFYS